MEQTNDTDHAVTRTAHSAPAGNAANAANAAKAAKAAKAATAPDRRARLARIPGILFLAAVLVLPLSGAMALDNQAAAVLPPEPAILTPTPQAQQEAAESALPVAAVDTARIETPAEAPTEAPVPKPDIATGDRLDDAERDAFLAWVEAQKAAGEHRGIAVYASW